MSFPTSGYSATEVRYSFNVNNGISFNLGISLDYPTEIEAMLPYLESALADFKSNYQTGESTTVTIYKTINGYQTASL